ncbi:arylsulfatase B-like isoform X1 [Bolinopsis microptera]|uniref:arylsulfatase B-like isoform X1 n=1 Tax=Bolinopsis microptera TaxID=2820187 RepID=UPI003079E9C0
MVMSYQNPHAPITPMDEDVAQNEDIENENRRKMAAMITSLDYGVGRITSALEKTHQLNNTIIIFLSDNGGHLMMPSGESLGSSNLPFRGAKCTLYEGGVRTPAFIKIPHLITPGQVNSSVKYDGLFHISDWFPTIVSLAQLDPRLLKKELQFQDDKKPYLDGIDHSETFKQLLDETQKAEAPRDHVVLDIDPVFNQAAIIKGKYKLIVGKAAFMDFDQVYPLIDDNSIQNEDIVVNASYYKISPNISQQMRAYAETQTKYAADPLKCLNLDCMTKDKLLFDLSWDVTESNDLSWRFSAETDELYETLRTYSNRNHKPVEPKFFEDQNEEAKKDDVWTPWLLNSTEV